MTELRQVAESRVDTALNIEGRDALDFEMEVLEQQQGLWPWHTNSIDAIDYAREAILSIMSAILAGHYIFSEGPTIRQLALDQLDKDMVSDNQSEEAWEWYYQRKLTSLVWDGKEDSEEAEVLTIMIDTLNLYRRHGVFKCGEYCPSKVWGADGRRYQEHLASHAPRRLRGTVYFPYQVHH
jgi:hypothetical protein